MLIREGDLGRFMHITSSKYKKETLGRFWYYHSSLHELTASVQWLRTKVSDQYIKIYVYITKPISIEKSNILVGLTQRSWHLFEELQMFSIWKLWVTVIRIKKVDIQPLVFRIPNNFARFMLHFWEKTRPSLHTKMKDSCKSNIIHDESKQQHCTWWIKLMYNAIGILVIRRKRTASSSFGVRTIWEFEPPFDFLSALPKLASEYPENINATGSTGRTNLIVGVWK